MNSRHYVTSAIASILVSVFATACAVSAEDPESTGTADQALRPVGPMPTVVAPSTPPPPPPAPAFPPPNASYCPKVQRACSIEPAQGQDTLDAELQALGCSPAQHWFNGESSGLLGGIVTLCNDTPAVRAHFSPFQITALANTCNACLPRAPCGEIYVLIEGFIGPNCQSGCHQPTPGTKI